MQPLDTPRFTLVAGALCLDFANTGFARATVAPGNKLTRPDNLAAFAFQTRLCAEHDARTMLSHMGEAAADILARAIDLREAVYRIFRKLGEDHAPAPDDLALVKAVHVEALRSARLAPDGAGRCWVWPPNAPAAALLFGHVTGSALDLMRDGQPSRIRACPRQDCGFLFVDTSKAGRRRWCEMEICGNRAKQDRRKSRQS